MNIDDQIVDIKPPDGGLARARAYLDRDRLGSQVRAIFVTVAAMILIIAGVVITNRQIPDPILSDCALLALRAPSPTENIYQPLIIDSTEHAVYMVARLR